MENIKEVSLNGNEFNIKDQEARTAIDTVNQNLQQFKQSVKNTYVENSEDPISAKGVKNGIDTGNLSLIDELYFHQFTDDEIFEEQTIQIDSSKYKAFMIYWLFCSAPGNQYRFMTTLPKTLGIMNQSPPTRWSTDIYVRNCDITNNGIAFKNAYKAGAPDNAQNKYLIPIKIYGIK